MPSSGADFGVTERTKLLTGDASANEGCRKKPRAITIKTNFIINPPKIN